MTSDLTGHVAVVTGVAGRLGGLWASALVAAGARVVGLDLARRAPDALGGLGPRFTYATADVADRASLEQVAAACDADGITPTVLVNNAGIDAPPDGAARTYRFGDVPDEDSVAILDVNATGTLRCCQVFGPRMAEAGGGSIVNIGSLYLGVAPDPTFYAHLAADPPFLKPPAYGMSKAAVHALTRYLATHWGPSGVRVNTLSPGGVRGDQDEHFVRAFTARVPLGRMAEHPDLVGPRRFLASDQSRYVTGTELLVDGGFRCW